MSSTLGPWRALCGALDDAEDRTRDAVMSRLRTLPLAWVGCARPPLTPSQHETAAQLHDAINRLVVRFFAALTSSPLAASLPTVLEGEGPHALAALRRAIRRAYRPIVGAALDVPELERERFAHRLVVVLQQLLGAIARLEVLALTAPPESPVAEDPRTTRALLAREAARFRGGHGA